MLIREKLVNLDIANLSVSTYNNMGDENEL